MPVNNQDGARQVSSDGQEIARKESPMNSESHRLSVWDIRACLLSSVDFAEDLAHDRPEFADVVTRFSQEVRRIKKELMIAFKDDFVSAPLHDIENELLGARVIASNLAKCSPEKSSPFNRFEEGLKHAQEEFIRKVRPEMYPKA